MKSKDIKILTIISAPSLTGGTPTKVLQLAQHSVFKHHIFFLNSGYIPEKFDEYFSYFSKYANCYDGRSCHYSYLKLFLAINKIVIQEKIDVIHTYFICEAILALFLKILHPDIKLIISFVSAVKTKTLLRRFLLGWALRKSDGIIYISKAVKTMRESEFRVLKHKYTRIIYNGIVKKENRNRIPESDICPGKRFKISYVGGFIDIKNHIVLVEAMRILRTRHKITDIGCILVGGPGPKEEQIRALVQEYGLNDCIQVYGPSDDVGDILAASQVYAHPCFLEGFGIAVAEAMLAGLPVLLADAAALPELITDGIEGRLLPPHDPESWAEAILELYHDRDKRICMGDAARHHAEDHFSIREFIKNSDQFYFDIINKSVSNAPRDRQ